MTFLPPTDGQLKRMKLELDQPDEVTKRDVQLLKEWLAKQPHLPKHMDDIRLERFLYGCKYSLERTKRVLDKYYTVRAIIPEFFSNRDPLLEEMQQWSTLVSFFILPSFTPEGYRVTILRLNSSDMTHFDVEMFGKWMMMTLDARILEEKCLNNVIICDLQNMTMSHYAQCFPTLPVVKKIRLSGQDAVPMRLARLHLINTPGYIDKLIGMFSGFFKEKFLKRIVFHTEGGECLQEYYPKEMLPFEYGGGAGSIEELNDDWKRKLVHLRPWFKEEERLSKSDESKRIVTNDAVDIRKLIDPTGGMSGSFRKFTID